MLRKGWSILLLLFAGAAFGSVPALVVSVADGDTITVQSARSLKERVRLLGIDAPEMGRSGVESECGGVRATAQVVGILIGQSVRLVRHGVDRYGRTLAFVYYDGKLAAPRRLRTNSINLYLVANGYARVEQRWKFPHEATYLRLEAQAKRRQYGSWGPCAGQAPWK